MSTRPFDQHIDASQLESYAAQLVDVTTETTIERHLLECQGCRATLAAVVGQGRITQITPDRLGTIWTEVASRIDQPPTSLLLRVRGVRKRLWDGVLKFLTFATVTRPFHWVRWAVVPVALVATALVIMNVVGSTTSATQQSATPPFPPADSVVGDTLHGLALNVTSDGGAAADFAPGTASAPASGQPAPASSGTGFAPPTVRTSNFSPGQFVAAFLPDAPDGNDVEVANGIVVAGSRAPARDAFTQTEARWQQVVARGLGAQIMVVDDGKFVVYVGPYETQQKAQALCGLSGPGLKCVPAQPRPSTDAIIRGRQLAV